jgi:2'-5' RNA ligase
MEVRSPVFRPVEISGRKFLLPTTSKGPIGASSSEPVQAGGACSGRGWEDDEPGCAAFSSTVPFPGPLRKPLAARLRDLEARFGATIGVDAGRNEVVLRCDTEHTLRSCQDAVREAIAACRSRADFTHFLSLPLHGVEPLDHRIAVLRSDADHLVRGKHHWQAGKHHVTLLMLRLLDDAEVARAVDTLKRAGPLLYDAVGTRCLVPRVQGVGVLPGQTPAKARVLVASVAEPELATIKRIHAVLVKAFRENGHLESDKQADPLVAHITLLRGDPAADVTEVLEKKASFDFGAHRIPAIHLSKRGQFGDDGYYKCEAKIDLP